MLADADDQCGRRGGVPSPVSSGFVRFPMASFFSCSIPKALSACGNCGISDAASLRCDNLKPCGIDCSSVAHQAASCYRNQTKAPESRDCERFIDWHEVSTHLSLNTRELTTRQKQVIESAVNTWCSFLVQGASLCFRLPWSRQETLLLDVRQMKLSLRSYTMPLISLARMDMETSMPGEYDLKLEFDEVLTPSTVLAPPLPFIVCLSFAEEKQRLSFALTMKVLRSSATNPTPIHRPFLRRDESASGTRGVFVSRLPSALRQTQHHNQQLLQETGTDKGEGRAGKAAEDEKSTGAVRGGAEWLNVDIKCEDEMGEERTRLLGEDMMV
ncbi:unnamed protein product [Vitrella brassicaformis CCMP3155]|uniref:Uncharacterized protein n=1 Tax=Vitrella brassicaformis (strain CCMP3155) TaxID=1169540 RepID=A0A0G4G7L4_VITBC|nr:unnamed protein product [Vitrella brassicaformis CCMP3155]|eukprot:CEM24595.1 unnamed protein product [Vitrella brassicaformis CCMP3155]